MFRIICISMMTAPLSVMGMKVSRKVPDGFAGMKTVHRRGRRLGFTRRCDDCRQYYDINKVSKVAFVDISGLPQIRRCCIDTNHCKGVRQMMARARGAGVYGRRKSVLPPPPTCALPTVCQPGPPLPQVHSITNMYHPSPHGPQLQPFYPQPHLNQVLGRSRLVQMAAAAIRPQNPKLSGGKVTSAHKKNKKGKKKKKKCKNCKKKQRRKNKNYCSDCAVLGHEMTCEACNKSRRPADMDHLTRCRGCINKEQCVGCREWLEDQFPKDNVMKDLKMCFKCLYEGREAQKEHDATQEAPILSHSESEGDEIDAVSQKEHKLKSFAAAADNIIESVQKDHHDVIQCRKCGNPGTMCEHSSIRVCEECYSDHAQKCRRCRDGTICPVWKALYY